ncbi:hypothetical protein SAMN05421688_0111 [Poseidonocella pacifica]|uniref:Uncharacterized protein n=1 Tax=Poseidonocella pacifica TaxID=871651 RepID=A0A1I0UZ04_9RHOB|nr:hypothetical protein SAMN05421688_0111 [Poseidonocella pacifica]
MSDSSSLAPNRTALPLLCTMPQITPINAATERQQDSPRTLGGQLVIDRLSIAFRVGLRVDLAIE